MIYEYLKLDVPIRQGDIFLGVPKVEIEFASGLPTLSVANEMEKIPWENIVQKGVPAPALLPEVPKRR